jgi:hypothetical protein
MSLNLRFSESDWERIERDWSTWWAGELERPLVVLECVEVQLPARHARRGHPE